MGSKSKFPTIAAVIVAAFILQIVLVTTAHDESPGKAAVEFSKAYFKLNKTMEKRLCSDLTEDGENDVVSDYIYRMADQARKLGRPEAARLIVDDCYEQIKKQRGQE